MRNRKVSKAHPIKNNSNKPGLRTISKGKIDPIVCPRTQRAYPICHPPVMSERVKKIIRSKIIPRDKLIQDRWYMGAGRSFHVAYWNGYTFRSFSYKFSELVERSVEHWDDNGSFAPFKLIEMPMISEVGQLVEK